MPPRTTSRATTPSSQPRKRCGLKVLGTLAYAPRWARSSACADSTACEPRNADEYAAWAGATVAHFKGRVSHWEVWNEPNIPNFWKPQPNVARYTALLRAAYPQIKAADPSAVVLAEQPRRPETTASASTRSRSCRASTPNGGQGFFDAWSHHAHPWPPGNVHADSAWYQMYGTTPSMRSLMQAAGDGQAALGDQYGPPTAGGPGAVNETTQAQHVTDAYRLWRSHTPGPARSSGTATATSRLRERRRRVGATTLLLRLLAEAGATRYRASATAA